MTEKKLKTNEDKILDKRSQIKKLQERIKSDNEKIKELERQIEVLESLQIKGVIKELELPFPEVIKLLKELKN